MMMNTFSNLFFGVGYIDVEFAIKYNLQTRRLLMFNAVVNFRNTLIEQSATPIVTSERYSV